MAPHLAKVEASIDPGLVMLNWTSLNIDTYIESVYDSLEELELLINRANDLVAYRIDAVLEEMSTIPLTELPTHTPKTIEEFLKSTEVRFDTKQNMCSFFTLFMLIYFKFNICKIRY